MAGVFGPRQEAESENGDSTAHTLSGLDVTRRVLSLVTFFAPAKKVTRRQAKPPYARRAIGFDLFPQKIEGVSPSRARYFLLLAQKKVPKENGFPRDINIAQGICNAAAIFGLAIHGSVRKRPPSMAGALRVRGTDRDPAKIKGKGSFLLSI